MIIAGQTVAAGDLTALSSFYSGLQVTGTLGWTLSAATACAQTGVTCNSNGNIVSLYALILLLLLLSDLLLLLLPSPLIVIWVASSSREPSAP